jgi:hypothetical protein
MIVNKGKNIAMWFEGVFMLLLLATEAKLADRDSGFLTFSANDLTV